MARIRRTNAELCASLKNERSKLYRKRTIIINSQKSKKIGTEAGNKKIAKLSAKIDSYASKIFKCGKRYSKLKGERMSKMSKVYRIKKELKTNRDMSKSARNKLLGTLNELNGDIRDISTLMGKEMVEQSKGRIGFVGDVGAMYSYEDVTVWEAKSKIEALIETMTFDYLIVGGETYSLEINKVSAVWAVDDYISDIVASQRDNKVQTPMVRIIADVNNSTIAVE